MWCGCGSTKRTWSCEAQLVDQRPDPGGLDVAVVAARPADDQQLRIGPTERGKRAHRHVGALQRLDAPDEQQHRCIGVERQRPTCARAFAGGEEGVLDAGSDDLDPPAGSPYSRRNCSSSACS